MPELFALAGLTDIDVTAFPLVLTDPNEAFGLPTWPRWWRDHGVGEWTDDDLSQWDRAIETTPNQGFLYALLYFVVAGTRS